MEETILLNAQDIQKAIPHRYPFLLVDRIISMVPSERITGLKNVTVNEEFFQGHFPGFPIMPGVLVIEAMAQTGSILAIKSSSEVAPEDIVVLFMGIDNAKFRKPVVPGDQLKLELEVMQKRPPYWKLKGKAFVMNKLVCEANLTAMVQLKKAK